MPSLKEVRNRIDSVKSTEQITNAMKMVAASKLRKAQDAILRLRPYANRLNGIIQNINESLDTPSDNPYGQRPEEPNRALLIVVTSNKGLCGTFNANVVKSAIDLLTAGYKPFLEANTLDIICIGKKGYEDFIRKGYPVIAEYNHILQPLTYNDAEPVATMVMDGYTEKRWDRITIVYNHFKNAAVQQVVQEQFLPMKSLHKEGGEFWGIDYLYEPGRAEILQELIPQALRTQFFKTLLDSFASEHGARMTAMHQASDNAREMLKELRLAYNKARQASITREIIEIVSGAEALNG
jgi:F-type H+-transporting ATPase subunit gamma